MKTDQKGFVLLTTAILLSLIMLLLLAQAESVILQQKSLNQLTTKAQHLQHLESIATRLIRQQNWLTDCLTNEMNPEHLLTVLKKKQQGCFITDNQFTFFYLIEQLGRFNCLIVQKDGVKYSTNHWRLSLVSTVTLQTAILQIRFAQLGSPMRPGCRQQANILPGILNWRYLT